MAKIEPVETAAEAGPDVVQVASVAVAEAATAATAASMDQVSDHGDGEQLSYDFQMDPAYTTSEHFENAINSGAANKRSKDVTQTLKTVVIISGAVVAVVGAILAVLKKAKKVS